MTTPTQLPSIHHFDFPPQSAPPAPLSETIEMPHNRPDDKAEDAQRRVQEQPLIHYSRPMAGDDSDDESAPRKKRRRQALSCTECKRRKIKCDRTQPCMPCTKRGETEKCIWVGAEATNEKYVSKSEFDTLVSRVKYLETLVQSMSRDHHTHPQAISPTSSLYDPRAAAPNMAQAIPSGRPIQHPTHHASQDAHNRRPASPAMIAPGTPALRDRMHPGAPHPGHGYPPTAHSPRWGPAQHSQYPPPDPHRPPGLKRVHSSSVNEEEERRKASRPVPVKPSPYSEPRPGMSSSHPASVIDQPRRFSPTPASAGSGQFAPSPRHAGPVFRPTDHRPPASQDEQLRLPPLRRAATPTTSEAERHSTSLPPMPKLVPQLTGESDVSGDRPIVKLERTELGKLSKNLQAQTMAADPDWSSSSAVGQKCRLRLDSILPSALPSPLPA